MAERRRTRILLYLAAAQGRGEATLVQRFGSHAHVVLKALFLQHLAEPDMGDRPRWRLTALGRAAARRIRDRAKSRLNNSKAA